MIEYADKLIVTVPLSILKCKDISFIPELSEQKYQAINGLGIGLMDKLLLEFDTVFWDKDLDWLNYVSDIPGEWT